MTIPGSLIDAIGSASANAVASQPTVPVTPPRQAERQMSDADIQAKLEQTAQTLLDRGTDPKDIAPVIQRQHAFLTGQLGQAVQKANTLTDTPTIEAGQGLGPAQAAAKDVGAGLSQVGQGLTLGALKYPLAVARGVATGESPSAALNEENQEAGQFGAEHPIANAGLNIAGGALNPVTAVATGARLKNAGFLGKAVLGAGEGAIQGGVRAGVESGGDTNTALQGAKFGALTGGVLTPAVGLVGKGIANLGLRTGATDALSKGLNTASEAPVIGEGAGNLAAAIGEGAGNLAAATGTRGQVNAAMGARENLLNAVGQDASGQTPATLQLAKDAQVKAQANELYTAAKQDQQVIQDPRFQELRQDPEVAKAFATYSRLRSAQGSPLPQASVLGAPPQAMVDKGIQGSDWQRLMAGTGSESSPFFDPARAAQMAATNKANISQLPRGLTGMGTEDMPDPEALATIKRWLGDAARGLDSPLETTKDAAQATLGKVAQIRNVLHDVSPAWKQADTYYADAMGQREAYVDGYNAFRGAKNIEGSAVPEKSAEAMEQTITTPRYASEPPEAQQNRLEAFTNGVKARQVDQVRGAPVDRAIHSAVNVPSLAPDAVTMGVRNLGNLNNPAAQSGLENTLATARGVADQSPPSMQNRIPTTAFGAVRAGLRKLVVPPDLLRSVPGQQMIAARTLNRPLNMDEIGQSTAGQTFLDALRQAAGNAGRKGFAQEAGSLAAQPPQQP